MIGRSLMVVESALQKENDWCRILFRRDRHAIPANRQASLPARRQAHSQEFLNGRDFPKGSMKDTHPACIKLETSTAVSTGMSWWEGRIVLVFYFSGQVKINGEDSFGCWRSRMSLIETILFKRAFPTPQG